MTLADLVYIEKGLASARPAAGSVPGKRRGWFSTDTGVLSIVGAGPAWVDIDVAAVAAGLAAHLGDMTDAHDASAISVADIATNFTGTDVEAVLAELFAAISGGGAPTTADYLVGTTDGGLSNEIVVGTTPGGELGGTWGSPTVDATHSGSSHAAVQSAAEATAAGALASHEADTTSIHGITDTSALVVTTDPRLADSRAPSGSAGGVLGGSYPNPSFAADMATQAELDAHTGDTSAAHAASAVSADSTTLVGVGTDVQAVLEELDNGIADHLADSSAAHAASAISADSTTLVGVGTDVQAVLEELDDAVAAAANPAFATPSIALGAAAAAGAAGTVIRSDSTIAAFDATSPTTQAFGDAAAVGTAAVAARRDHKHAMPAAPTSVSGNAGTATALQNSRNIDGQAFDGTGDITVIAPGTHAATTKATPVDADELPLVDSAASNVLKKLTWANLKATVKAYTDTLYTAIGASAPPNGSAAGDLTGTYPNPTLATAGGGAAGPTGSATVVPIVTVDAKGRVTALSSATAAPTNAAGGDLTGNYPNPTLATVGGGAAGPTGSATVSPIVTVDAKGRVTALSSATIVPTNAAGGDLTGNYPNPTLATAGPGATGPIGSAVVVPVVTIDAKGRVTALGSAVTDLSVVGGSTDFVLASNDVSSAATTLRNLSGFVWNMVANAKYVVDLWLLISPTAATTGLGLTFDVSVAVTFSGITFTHSLATTGTLSGGDSIADAATRSLSSGLPATGNSLVQGKGIVLVGANGGTCQLQWQPEVAAVSQITAGSMMTVRRIA